MFQLIIFDWDGTLMDSTRKITRCIQAAAQEMQLEVPSHDEAKWVIGLGLVEAMQALFPMVSKDVIGGVVESYKKHYVELDDTEQPLFDDVIDGLSEMAQAGALLAVATGKSRVGLNRVLTQSGLGDAFVTTRCADESRTKPNPQMLIDILDYTAIDAEHALMVGDTTFDMEMATNASMPGLAVSYGAHPIEQLQSTQASDIVDSFKCAKEWIQQQGIAPAYL